MYTLEQAQKISAATMFVYDLLHYRVSQKKVSFWNFRIGNAYGKFGPFWTMSDNFGPFLYFGPFWTVWTVLDRLDRFGPFGPFWTVWDRLDCFGPFWTILDRLDYFGPFWTTFDCFGPFWIIWTVKTVLDHLGRFVEDDDEWVHADEGATHRSHPIFWTRNWRAPQ